MYGKLKPVAIPLVLNHFGALNVVDHRETMRSADARHYARGDGPAVAERLPPARRAVQLASPRSVRADVSSLAPLGE